jgi:anti-anti-sigma factor
MQVATRHSDGVLIVDLFGHFPPEGGDHQALRTSLEDAMSGHSGTVIVHLRDADWMNATNLGVLVAAAQHSGIPRGIISIVTESERLRSILEVPCMFPLHTYKTEEEAIRSALGHNRPTAWQNISFALQLPALIALMLVIAIIVIIGVLVKAMLLPFGWARKFVFRE